uniref:SEC-C motif-containing protein n=1 Tax=Candidatus Kentrum sp. FM TaxID=2126340 RepID=A0A450TWM7_9GAMM|nr:MAG: SEC-C motif-containing protein [Candidatus Kentron sp. FM]VFJ73457.1 MAG: SEC-C motif-containing protein [Candidatus Kentron sp. FM]VFK20433.1 MAG: SEC-C motif-containing protein [Candidatus Kentron sp. FM]
MTIEEILAGLKYNERSFPRESLVEAIAHREEITPELLKIIEYSAENMEALWQEEGDYFAHVHAIYLLAQFRETRAYEPIIGLLSVPGKTTRYFVGIHLVSNIGRVLASVYNGDMNSLKGLIENEDADEFVRSAAIETLTILVATGEQTRENVIGYFKELFNAKLQRNKSEDSVLWSKLVTESARLYPEELYEEIKAAFDEDLVENLFMTLEDVDGYLAEGKEAVLDELRENKSISLIDDVIEEMEEWSCFRTPEENRERAEEIKDIVHLIVDKLSSEAKKRLRQSTGLSLSGAEQRSHQPVRRDSYVPYVRQTKKIGRNDPCPCGSGKKYKKCCLNN